MMDQIDKVKALEKNVNKFIDRVDNMTLYQVDKYRLVYYSLEYLRILGFRYDIGPTSNLVIVNSFHDPGNYDCTSHVK